MAVCVGLSLRPEYIVVCLHVWVLAWMWQTRSAWKRREVAAALARKKETFKKDLLVEALLQGGRVAQQRGKHLAAGLIVAATVEVLASTGKGNTGKEGKEGEKKGEKKGEANGEEEEGLGRVVHSLLALMPFYVKENLVWSQDLLRSSAHGLIYVYDVLHWEKNETTTWAIFASVAVSLLVFTGGWGDMNWICLWFGVLFVLSGTIPFQIVMTAVVGVITTLMTVARYGQL
jgi:hypothetical protein